MNALIPIKEIIVSGEQKQTVNARDLHDFLEVGRVFAAWIQERIEQGGFVENEDYVVVSQTGKNRQGGRPTIDYYLALDMAKELSMIERNDKGKQARQYFIACEKKLKAVTLQHSIPQTFSEALRLAADLAEQIALAAPKVEQFDKFIDGSNHKTMGAVAKALGTGRNRLFAFLKAESILMGNGVPYQEYIERGYFVVKEKPLTMGEANVNYSQTYVTAKGEAWIAKLLERKAA